MSKTDTEDWDLGGFHQSGQMVDGLLAVSWITWSIGKENTVEVVSHLVDWEVVWEHGNTGTAADQASQDVLLNTAVDHGYVHITIVGADVEWGLCADFLDQVDLFRVDEGLILIGIIFFSNGDSGQRRTLLSQECDNGTSINTRDCWHSLASTPLTQAFYSGPMAVFLSIVCHHDTNALDVWGFEVFEKSVIISS